jgi:hypothetical protein
LSLYCLTALSWSFCSKLTDNKPLYEVLTQQSNSKHSFFEILSEPNKKMLQNDENLKKQKSPTKTQILLSLIWVKATGGYSISVDSVVDR